MLKKSKRIQAILLMVMIMLTTTVSCAATQSTSNIQTLTQMGITENSSYNDIKSNWAYEAISYVLNEGYFAGTSDTTFSPSQTVTRTAFATVLSRLADSSENAEVSDGSSNLTREDMAVLLYNYAKSAGLLSGTTAITTNSFTDSSDISGDATEAVNAVTSLGLMSGKADGTFSPSGTTTRAEAATVIYRLCKLVNAANTSDSLISEISEKAASIEQYTNYKNDAYQTITLNGSSISFKGTGATVDSNTITITKAGTYVISGSLKDGRIIVDSEDNENVRLVLNNVSIASSDGSPIIAKNAKNTIISLPADTNNTLTDSAENENEEVTGTLFSADDLWINGSGTLTISANNKDGISGNDDIKITEANLVINSVDDGIVANDSVSVNDANITITAAGDGIKTTNGGKIGKGYIAIKDGTFNINAAADGIQAETLLYIDNGSYKIETSGSDSDSAKALKASSGIVVLDGTYDIDCTDDALHTNGLLSVKGGSFDINAGDDGLHADASLSISGGTIDIINCYEGIESAEITISGGNINLIASDDGINVAGGASSSQMGGKPNQSTTASTSCYTLTISGGDINVNASGDGIDVNGSAYMTGGNVLVSGPTNNGNGALDYDGVFEVSGGTLLAAGSTGMAMAPSPGSTQYTIANTTGTQSAGTTVKLVDNSGNTIATITPAKEYGHIVISSPDIKEGSTYTLYAGNTEIETFTISKIISGNTASGGGMPDGGGKTPPTDGPGGRSTPGGTPPNQQ